MNENKSSIHRGCSWMPAIVYFVLFFLWIFYFPVLQRLAAPWLPAQARIVSRTPLYVMAGQHLLLSGLSTALAVCTSLFIGVLVRLSRSGELKTIVMSASSIGETIPSVAIIALAVPVLGYGNGPCILALYIYAILPVVRNAIIGFESVSPTVLEAGIGMGMSRFQLLWQVDLPLAKPIIVAGIRMALVINISAATIGATIGAGGFGVPIISGIRVYDPVMVIQGSVPVLLLALLADRLLRHGQRRAG